MKRHNGWGLVIALLIISATVSPGITYAQGPAARYFPETGHWVAGQFLDFYESIPAQSWFYGYPITEEIVSRIART
jgi:hypothetical protein